MTKFNQLTNLSRHKPSKRKGRGIAAGSGKTAGRGTKGQRSRSGSKIKPFFEGGQMPLVRKLPKLAGFKSHRPKATIVYSGMLDNLKTNSKIIDNHTLKQTGLIDDAFCKVKIIDKGEIKKAHQVQLQAASQSVRAKIEQAGGTFTAIAIPKHPTSIKKAQRSEAKAQRQTKKTTIK